MLEQVQVIKENNEVKYAIIPYAEFLQIKQLLSDEELLTDYLDYLHAQTVKEETEEYFTLAEVRELLAQDQ